MGRFSRTSAPESDAGQPLRVAAALAPRVEVPVRDAWQRLPAGRKRRAFLETAFSQERMAAGVVFGLFGRMYSGKTASALAVCDLRGLRAAYATTDSSRPALEPQPGLAVIIDPVSVYNPHDVQACIDAYRGVSPVILIDRYQEKLEAFVDPTARPTTDLLVRVKMPNAAAITEFLGEMLAPYQHLAALDEHDLQLLGNAMSDQLFSLPQVNQVTVDAVLSSLQEGRPISRPEFERALERYRNSRTMAAGGSV